MSTKIKSIKVYNYKAVENQEIDLNGASVIVTGGNNRGKTSLLKGLAERFQGEKPDIIVKQGEEKGESVMELTDGSKIGWKFTAKNETFYYITPDEIKMTTGVLSAIGEKVFGNKFDIDKFLISSNNEQNKQVKNLLGIDLSELDAKYKSDFDERTIQKRELKTLIAKAVGEPVKVDSPDIEGLKTKKEELQTLNENLKKQWNKDNKEHQKEAIEFNDAQKERTEVIYNYNEFKKDVIIKYSSTMFNGFFNIEKFNKHYESLLQPEEIKDVVSLVEPTYKDFTDIDKQIEDAYTDKANFDNYETKLQEFKDWKIEGLKVQNGVIALNDSLDKINKERLDKIKEANLPEEFELTDDGLLYKGLPLDTNQISNSAKYICALKLGFLGLGRLRAMHFEASSLDKNSLKEVQEWADKNDLQLLIERAEFEGGDIKYEIIEEK
tara:strand:+ start:1186 stop:2499 length:1314 start_codon:yes stop_codon:yes gene_type:complete